MTDPYAVVCLARCWPCMLADQPDDHPHRPHTWMDDDDITADPTVTTPATDAEWTALAEARPCNCHCNRKDNRP